jgi:hypothetical protein
MLESVVSDVTSEGLSASTSATESETSDIVGRPREEPEQMNGSQAYELIEPQFADFVEDCLPGEDMWSDEIPETSWHTAILQTPQMSFVDDRTLMVPELELLKTANVFAKLLKCEDAMWSPQALRTLDLTLFEAGSLPQLLHPTPAQQQLPHHPLLDILPWPSVRAKLVCVFHQPPEQRPPIARDEMAILRLAYDIDDATEGVKVCGADRLDTSNWEVGQQVFEGWWWAFDWAVIHASNTLRAKRGAPRLQLPST